MSVSNILLGSSFIFHKTLSVKSSKSASFFQSIPIMEAANLESFKAIYTLDKAIEFALTSNFPANFFRWRPQDSLQLKLLMDRNKPSLLFFIS